MHVYITTKSTKWEKKLDLLVLKFLILIGANKLLWSCVVLVRLFPNIFMYTAMWECTQCTNSLCLGTELTFCSAVSIWSLYSFRTRGDGESLFSCKSLNSSSIFLTEEEIDRPFLCRASSRKRSLHLPSTFRLGRIPSPWELQGPVHRHHGVGH